LPKLFTGLLNNLFSFSAKAAAVIRIRCSPVSKFFDAFEFAGAGIAEAHLVGLENNLTDYAHD